jgi:3-deoxy-manno-octulosonate cytidylyltransferase (CMP-KDO synthetase)
VRALGVIPARYASKRFPGKPLVRLAGRPLVEWVYQAAAACSQFERVVVATDSREIADCVLAFGGEIEMTRGDHATGTDRVAEAAARYPDSEVVANIQGDQPFVTSGMLEQLLEPYLRGERPDMTTLACPLSRDASPADPNVVKVVRDRNERALYFSRAPIPYRAEHSAARVLHHLGLYAFRADFLPVYARLPQTELEDSERLEQLRALEHGFEIRVCLTEAPVLEVNTPGDLERAHAVLSESARP